MNLKKSVFIILLIVIGCKKENNPAVTVIPPTAAPTSTNIWGRVVLYDFGQTPSNLSGVSISLDGTTYATVSDSFGNWIIHSVPAGTYDVSFYKPGYFREQYFNQRFVACDSTQFYCIPVNLSRIPSYYVSHLSIQYIDSLAAFLVQCTKSHPDSLGMYTEVFFSKQPITTQPFFFLTEFGISFIPDSLNGSRLIGINSLGIPYQLQAGDTVYAVATSGGDAYYAKDPANGLEFDQPEITLSNVVTFQMP